MEFRDPRRGGEPKLSLSRLRGSGDVFADQSRWFLHRLISGRPFGAIVKLNSQKPYATIEIWRMAQKSQMITLKMRPRTNEADRPRDQARDRRRAKGSAWVAARRRFGRRPVHPRSGGSPTRRPP